MGLVTLPLHYLTLHDLMQVVPVCCNM